jgi:hypothetical protein
MTTARTSQRGTATNGHPPAADAFPLDTFREAALHLRRPFTTEAVKFKVQATWPKDNPTAGLVVCYIDARLVVERLNLIIPDRWADAYEPVGKDLLCHLTVDGITRTDIGQGTGKGLYSDALKRAAVKFGIGVSLYATPKMIVKVDAGQAKQRRNRDGLTLEVTPNGEKHVRDLYAAWLDVRGQQAFGLPLDHGDVEGAQGDAEVEDAPEPEPTHATPVAPPPEPLPASVVAELQAARKDAQVDEGWLRMQLIAVGVDDVPDRITLPVITRLTPSQANDLLDALNQVIEARATGES